LDLNAREEETTMLRREVEQLQARLTDTETELQRVKDQV